MKSAWFYGDEYIEVEGYTFNEKELVNLRRFCFQTNISESLSVVNSIASQTSKIAVVKRKDSPNAPLGVKKVVNLSKKTKVNLKKNKN